MAQYDPKTGKLRPTWKVSFSPWHAMLGSLIGGATTGLLLAIQVLIPTGSGTGDGGGAGVVAITLVGGALAVFALLGPALGYGLGFALRNNENHFVHVIAFAGLGLVVGFMVGDVVGRFVGAEAIGFALAPVFGIGAAVGRWFISRYAK